MKVIAVDFLLLPSGKRYLHAAFDVYACMYSYIQQHKNMFYHEVACRAAAAIDRMAAVRARHHRQMVVARKEGIIVGQFMCSR